MHPYFAEALGTALLILFGNGVVANVVLSKSKANNGGWIVITMGWGLAVALAVYVVGRVSGAHINPAVTIGLASIGAFEWSQVPGYILSQIAGGFIGSVLVYLCFYAHWEETEDPDLILACHSTSPAIRKFIPAFVTEFIGTVVLVFCILALGKVALGADSTQLAWTTAMGTWFGPLLVGLLVLAIGLSLGGPTGYAINPARDLGPRIAHTILPIKGKGSSDWAYAWVPIVAPILGAVAGAQLFVFSAL
ncbi:aquaporin family protein [Coraliomargarita sp. SDUM461003]|uniref:Aquaporin family protein n=1 Tax=Thalassobacterium maritimum TaxID=3041265 RepID=A0ABU1ARS7_9BACT|nr:MIP/aquaporin family protein [Coraliomargarita sp. SDUM461003]MBT61910.1 aquaporin [Puniceicoccaceae bacterium]MDQ8206748.1 aquaporin family protein [Coraliomargarita sp. SDUM461003]|tara:strand:- start:4284 stop:5030 length:747 start_codon:yes stop_codon:yes gene_type:complete